jgi:hypothetical protein
LMLNLCYTISDDLQWHPIYHTYLASEFPPIHSSSKGNMWVRVRVLVNSKIWHLSVTWLKDCALPLLSDIYLFFQTK